MARTLGELLILVVSGLALADGIYLAVAGRYHPVVVYARTLNAAAAIRWEGVGSLTVAFVGLVTVWVLDSGTGLVFGMLVLWAILVVVAAFFPATMAQRAEAAGANRRARLA